MPGGRPKGDALARFAAKCRFDPVTGCVEWTGGTTSGKGSVCEYGSFWFEGRRWFAHRWAARFIHGLEIDGLDVDHECRNRLCQQHLQAIPHNHNCWLVWARQQEEPEVELNGIPFHLEPAWLKPFIQLENNDDECPF